MTYDPSTDPADSTVADVTDYLATADAAEVERIQGLEAAEGGKGRKGIVDWVPDADTFAPDDDGYSRILVEDAYQPGAPIERDDAEDDTLA